jgi:hypothetical protein
MESNDRTENRSLNHWVKSNVAPLVTLTTFITIFFGGFLWIEGRYASAEQLAQLEQRFEMKIRSDSLREIDTRRWQLQDRLEKNPQDQTAKEDLRQLDAEKAQIQRELDSLRGRR